MHTIMDFSSLITRLQAWDSVLLRFVASWVIPYQSDRKIADQLGEIIRAAPKLEYVGSGGGTKGERLAWTGEVAGENSLEAGAKRVVVKRPGVNRMKAVGRSLARLIGFSAALVSFIWLIVRARYLH